MEDVKPGDVLRVRPGEKVPVDGSVVDGAQGRRVDAERRAHPRREGGGRPRDRRDRQRHRHAFTMRAERVGAETVLAQIVDMVARARAAARRSIVPGRRGGGVVRAALVAQAAAGVRGAGRSPGRSRASRTRW
ncbi:MAG: hypothetical protein U1E86_28365 [Burkholderiaceae bacterium]